LTPLVVSIAGAIASIVLLAVVFELFAAADSGAVRAASGS